MASYTRKTIALPARKVVNTAQKIQRDYYNKVREFLATASDEQIDLIEKALGKADTLGAFAIEQEREARKEKMLGFTVFQTEIPATEATDTESDDPDAYDQGFGYHQ